MKHQQQMVVSTINLKMHIKQKSFFLIIIIGLLLNSCNMNEEKLSINNDYYFLLLDNNYSENIKTGFVKDFNEKRFEKVNVSLNRMLSELNNSEHLKQNKYRDYYETYEQILTYDEYLSSRKELAKNVLTNLKDKIEKNDVNEDDFLPFLEYYIFREYSLYFKSDWYCLPYLRFSDKLIGENNIDFSKIFDIENELIKVNAFDFFEKTNTGYDNDEYQNFIKVNVEQADMILKLMISGGEETNNEFYLFYHTLQRAKNNEYTLLYTIY